MQSFPDSLCQLSESIKVDDRESSPGKPRSRKIGPKDTFPCYSCANDRMLVRDCDVCQRTGVLYGCNPMVRLIEKIIDCKIEAEQLQTTNVQSIRLNEEKEEVSSVRFSSGDMHEDYTCDECKMEPIRGRRYHCRECDDFDLCEDCHSRTNHPHQLTDMLCESKLKKSIALDRKTQRSVLMSSCGLSINRLSQM